MIQHISLTLEWSERLIWNSKLNERSLEVFQDVSGGITRKSCRILVKNRSHRLDWELAKQELWKLSGCRNFQVVTVEVSQAWFVSDLAPSSSGFRGLLLRTLHKPKYSVMKEGMESFLGPAMWREGETEGGRYLEFRPRSCPDVAATSLDMAL